MKHIGNGKVDNESHWGPTNVFGSSIGIQGMELDLHKVMQNIMNNQIRVVNLYGPDHVGKTTFVKELSRFITMRNTVKDGVFYYNLDKMKTSNDAESLF